MRILVTWAPVGASSVSILALCYFYSIWHAVPLMCAISVYAVSLWFEWFIYVKNDRWLELDLMKKPQKNMDILSFRVLLGRTCWAVSAFSFLVMAVGLSIISGLMMRDLIDCRFLIFFVTLGFFCGVCTYHHRNFAIIEDATMKIFSHKGKRKKYTTGRIINIWKCIIVAVSVFGLVVTIGASTSTFVQFVNVEANEIKDIISKHETNIEILIYIHSITLVILLMHIYFDNSLPDTAIDDPVRRWRKVAASITLYLGSVQTLLLVAVHLPVFVFVWMKFKESLGISFFASGIAILGPVLTGTLSALLSHFRGRPEMN